MSLITAAETLPFGVAAALIIGIALLEGLGMLFALSPSNLLDDFLPDIDGDTGLDRVLGWLHLGRVPVLVVLLLFLTGYSLFGYALQWLLHSLSGSFLPGWVAGILALPAGMTTARALGSLIAAIIPQDESSAVSEQSLIGRIAVITHGSARRGLAAQARVKDRHGRTHHLLVEPDLDEAIFDEGTEVLIVRKIGPFYRCIVNPHPDVW